MRGTVKFFDRQKGWGFITSDEGTDYFVHFSGIQGKGYRYLDADDIVSFDVKECERGWQASDVIPILTLKMVGHELKKEKLSLCECEKDKHKWMIADSEKQKLVVDKEMNLVEVAAYAGIDVEGIMDKLDNPVIKECAGQVAEAFHTKVLADVVTDAIEKVIEQ